MNRIICTISLAAALGGGGLVKADNDVLDELYGIGYHAFFGHDWSAAEQALSTAINEGSKDPRVHYYRGLVFLCQGRSSEADADFHQGATFEAEGHGRLVGRALERIQGPARLRLERARLAARLEVERRRGFEQPAPTPPAARQLPPMPNPPRRDPFGDRVEPAEPAVPVPPEASDEPALELPPADEAPAAPMPDDAGNDDAFGTDSPEPAPAEDDPFGL